MSVTVKETRKKSPIIPHSAFRILLCIPSGLSSLARKLFPLSCFSSGGAAPRAEPPAEGNRSAKDSAFEWFCPCWANNSETSPRFESISSLTGNKPFHPSEPQYAQK